MSEQETPQESGPSEESTPAPEPSPPAADQGGGTSSNRNVMIVLAYFWILFLVPFLVEKDDAEVQWHAKHGLVLTVFEFLVHLVVWALAVGCFFFAFVSPLIFIGFAVVRIIAIVKGINGERFHLPGISQYSVRF